MRRLELADFFDREGITLRFDVDVPAETFGVDSSLCAVVVPNGEIPCEKRVARLIEHTNRQTMVARQGHPLPKIRYSGHIALLRAETA